MHDSKTDKSLGRLDFPVDRLLKNKEMRFKQPFNLTGAKENSTLTMILELKVNILFEVAAHRQLHERWWRGTFHQDPSRSNYESIMVLLELDQRTQ